MIKILYKKKFWENQKIYWINNLDAEWLYVRDRNPEDIKSDKIKKKKIKIENMKKKEKEKKKENNVK